MYRLLIVDDEPMLREGLAEQFEWSKFNIHLVGCSRDGVEALKLFEETRPDIILTDVRMPRMNGLEFGQRARGLAPDVQIIFLSGFEDIGYLRGAIKVQAADYLLKPLKLDDLKCVLHEVTGRIDKARAQPKPGLIREQTRNRIIHEQAGEDSKSNQTTNQNRWVAKIKQLVELKMSGKLTITDLAKEMYMAPNYLSTLFKQETGYTINQYLMKARLDKAIDLMSTTNRRIIDIATEVGYPDPAYFTKLFKKYTGLNPSEYRNTSDESRFH